ncbi:MAG: hypothetical protein QXE12_04090 [Conexivisphaerales archaeon]
MFDIISFLFLGGAVTFISSLLLTNSVESLDAKTSLGTTFVGAIVTPLFTSLPEMIVFFVAILFYSGSQGDKIGIGTLFGQPFITSSLSYGLIGFSIILGLVKKKRQRTYATVDKNLTLPYIFISILFPLLYIPSLLVLNHLQFLFAIMFGASYIWFVYLSYRNRIIGIKEQTQPYFKKYFGTTHALIIQLTLTTVGLYLGTHFLIESLVKISSTIQIDPMALSIIIVPLTTAIPETLNAMVWGYKGKDSLAISALVGEKVLYSTFYPALGLLTVAWSTTIYSDLSILFTTTVSLMMWYFIRERHIPLYAFFIGLLFFISYTVIVLNFP